METKQLIISSNRKSLKVFNIICLSLSVLAVIVVNYYVDVINNGYFEDLTITESILYVLMWVGYIMGPTLVILGIINGIFILCDYSITVYDKEIVGQVFMKRKVSLPLDSVSAVQLCSLNGIAVATSSGVIKFRLIANNKEIFEEINKLLLQRQNTKSPESVVQQIVNQTSAKELKEYKELLDSGVITQEEFDAKKKQLLGL